MTVRWEAVAAADLDVRRLHDLLQLRSRIFVVEQDCAYQDVDGLDLLPGTWHVLAYDGDALVAYARVLEATACVSHSGRTDGLRIGRVLVDASQRGRRLGHELVRRCLEVCRSEHPGVEIVLSAQAHLVDFYGGFGFTATGDEYDEDGIPHVDMRLTA
ncbi:MAG: GNAT family N-acetyltransferase [Myxococcales bacterium]|nr:MAG: GNAT family N-acetyltransferase [Myxococcales bacterium]